MIQLIKGDKTKCARNDYLLFIVVFWEVEVGFGVRISLSPTRAFFFITKLTPKTEICQLDSNLKNKKIKLLHSRSLFLSFFHYLYKDFKIVVLFFCIPLLYCTALSLERRQRQQQLRRGRQRSLPSLSHSFLCRVCCWIKRARSAFSSPFHSLSLTMLMELFFL